MAWPMRENVAGFMDVHPAVGMSRFAESGAPLTCATGTTLTSAQ